MPAAEEHPTDWYVLRGRARGGPYPYAMVREGARGGLISKVDLLWRPGWVDWRDAGAVDGLLAAATAATPVDRDAASLERTGLLDLQPATGNAATSIPQPGAGLTSAAGNPDHISFNYVAAHWRGEFSLLTAFFGNGTIVGLILLIAVTIFVTVLKENKVTDNQYAAMIVALSIIYLVSIVWLLVGICRSALRRRSRRGVDGRSALKPDTQPIMTARPPPPPPAPS